MKKVHSLSVLPNQFAPGRLRRDSSQRLIHDLLNQLSVINLCSFTARGRRSGNDVANYDKELSAIEAAVTAASELAEALKTLWDKPDLATRARRGSGLKKSPARSALLKVVPARAVGVAPFGD